MLEQAAGRVPEVLVQRHLALGVEADVGHADGSLLLAAGEALEAQRHLPAEVVVAVLGDEVRELDGAVVDRLGARGQVLLDRGGAADGLEGVVEEDVLGVDVADAGAEVGGFEVAEEVLEAGDGLALIFATGRRVGLWSRR